MVKIKFRKAVIADVRALVEAYARGHGGKRKDGLPVSTVSLRMYGNALVLDDFLAEKRSMSIDKVEQMVEDFRADWPASEPWPKLKRLY